MTQSMESLPCFLRSTSQFSPGVLLKRIIVFWGLCWCSLLHGNYHMPMELAGTFAESSRLPSRQHCLLRGLSSMWALLRYSLGLCKAFFSCLLAVSIHFSMLLELLLASPGRHEATIRQPKRGMISLGSSSPP